MVSSTSFSQEVESSTFLVVVRSTVADDVCCRSQDIIRLLAVPGETNLYNPCDRPRVRLFASPPTKQVSLAGFL